MKKAVKKLKLQSFLGSLELFSLKSANICLEIYKCHEKTVKKNKKSSKAIWSKAF